MSSDQTENHSDNDLEKTKAKLGIEESKLLSLDEFRALVRKYQHRLIRYAFYRLGNLEDAEDVIQKVFTKAYLMRNKEDKNLRVVPYLYRMAANACIDFQRKANPVEIPLKEISYEQLAAEHEGSEINTVAIEIRRIEALLSLLPEKQTEVIRFCVIDELSFAEIAEIIGCSVNTVRSRFRYGIEKLRSKVSKIRR